MLERYFSHRHSIRMRLNETVEGAEFGVICSWSSTPGLPIFPNALRAMSLSSTRVYLPIVAVRTQPFGWFHLQYILDQRNNELFARFPPVTKLKRVTKVAFLQELQHCVTPVLW